MNEQDFAEMIARRLDDGLDGLPPGRCTASVWRATPHCRARISENASSPPLLLLAFSIGVCSYPCSL